MDRPITNSERSATACWQKWMWQYGLRLRPSIAAGHFLRGNVWHAAMDVYHVDGLDAALSEVDDRLGTSEFGLLEFGRESYAIESSEADALGRTLKQMLRQYDIKYADSRFKVTHVEEAIVCDVGGYEFSGKVDKIMQCQNTGRNYIVDHKTTSMPIARWQMYNDYSPQMLGYAMLAEETLGIDVYGVMHDVVMVPKLREHSIQEPRKCGTLREWKGRSLPNTTPDAWRESMELADDHSDAAKLVHKRLIEREFEDVEMQRIERTLDWQTMGRLKTELGIVADLIAVHDKPLDDARELVLQSFKGNGDLTFDESLRKVFREYAPSYVRNHGECNNKGACEYASLCKRGEMEFNNQFRVSSEAHEELVDEDD